MADAREVRAALRDAYGGYSDKRLKGDHPGAVIDIDGRGERDRGADGKLYPWFVPIQVQVTSADEVTVLIRTRSFPSSPAVEMWLEAHGMHPHLDGFSFTIQRGQEEDLRALGKAWRAIVRRGAPRYPEASWKYTAPNSAEAVETLAARLSQAWAG